MKVFRRLLVVAGVAALALGALVAVAFNSGVQTWALRRTLAKSPDLRASLGSVSAGVREVDLRDLEYRDGAAVLSVPRVYAEVPLLPAGLHRQVRIAKLEASGWTLDLSRVSPPPSAAQTAAGAANGQGQPGAAVLPPATEAVKAFAGVFAHLGLPVDLTLDGLALDGVVILPEGRGRVHVNIKGGGLGTGREGIFTVTATAALSAAEVSRVDLKATVSGTMDSPRTFTRLGLVLAADATGTQFPTGAKLAVDVAAARTSAGESYSAAVVSGLRELMKIEAAFPPGGNRLEGTWRLDVRDADVLPFVLGHPLPTFAVVGEGRLGADAAFAAMRIAGRLEATAGRLRVVAPQLAAWGDVALVTQFDVTRRKESVAAERFEATLSAAQPVATLRMLQPFEYRPGAREFRPTHEDRALLGVVLHALPVEWTQPWTGETAVTGGAVRGEVRVWSRPGGGVGVRTETPLSAGAISIRSASKAWLQDVGVTIAGGADFSKAGWQVDLTRFELQRGDAKLASVVAKLGQLAGADQAVKSTGSVGLNLVEVVKQPAAGAAWALTAGAATIDYAASIGRTQQWVAKVDLSELAGGAGAGAGTLPRVTADLRLDIGAGGRAEFHLPLTFKRDDRTSDALVAGSLEWPKPGEANVEATVSSARLVIDDVRALGAVRAEDRPAETISAGRAPWAGLSGTLGLSVKEAVWSETLTVRGLTGRLRLDAGAVKMEEFQAGLGDQGRANLKGALTFEPGAERPFALAAEVMLRDVDSGLVFNTAGSDRPATVEGRFDLASTVASRAKRLGELAREAGGEVAVTSRGGVFRGLPVAFAHPVEATGKLASFVATAGSVFSGFAGRKEHTEIGTRAQAVGEFARALSPIAFDQLSLVVTRDAALNTTLRDFVLIAPELRLTGGGTALHRPGGGLFDDALAMEFKLRARGRQGELLKFLGVLDPQADELGYLPCTVPLRIAGSLARPDASEINVKLAALALEKAGVTEKASELFNRVFGGGK